MSDSAPTTLVSFLGVGRKENKDDPRSAYAKTRYRFPSTDSGECVQESSLFGAALMGYLKHRGTPPDRWIILGTSASLWSELHQILPDPDAVLEEYCSIDERVLARTVDAQSLAQWQDVLNRHATPLQLRLCLTDEALHSDSQQQISSVLFEHVPVGSNLVVDITHGFRHQPVIATFVVSLMRWTHNINKISFYSGVFEARQDDVTPVLELPICQQLTDAAEAAAILHLTGNYQPLAAHLGFDGSAAWFFESTNQIAQARRHAQSLYQEVSNAHHIVQPKLIQLLRDRLAWSQAGSFARRCKQSAQSSLERGDYLRALILGYEAIIIHAVQILHSSADPLDYRTREHAERSLSSKLVGEERNILKILEWTRNACAHGARSDQNDVQRVLFRAAEFRKLMESAFDLFERLPRLLTLPA